MLNTGWLTQTDVYFSREAGKSEIKVLAASVPRKELPEFQAASFSVFFHGGKSSSGLFSSSCKDTNHIIVSPLS